MAVPDSVLRHVDEQIRDLLAPLVLPTSGAKIVAIYTYGFNSPEEALAIGFQSGKKASPHIAISAPDIDYVTGAQVQSVHRCQITATLTYRLAVCSTTRLEEDSNLNSLKGDCGGDGRNSRAGQRV